MSAETHTALRSSSRKNATISGLLKSVPALGEAFGKFDEEDLDLLEGKEREMLRGVMKTAIVSLNGILLVLNSAPTSASYWHFSRKSSHIRIISDSVHFLDS